MTRPNLTSRGLAELAAGALRALCHCAIGDTRETAELYAVLGASWQRSATGSTGSSASEDETITPPRGLNPATDSTSTADIRRGRRLHRRRGPSQCPPAGRVAGPEPNRHQAAATATRLAPNAPAIRPGRDPGPMGASGPSGAGQSLQQPHQSGCRVTTASHRGAAGPLGRLTRHTAGPYVRMRPRPPTAHHRPRGRCRTDQRLLTTAAPGPANLRDRKHSRPAQHACRQLLLMPQRHRPLHVTTVRHQALPPPPEPASLRRSESGTPPAPLPQQDHPPTNICRFRSGTCLAAGAWAPPRWSAWAWAVTA